MKNIKNAKEKGSNNKRNTLTHQKTLAEQKEMIGGATTNTSTHQKKKIETPNAKY